jgi:bacteriorhodopsin
MFLFSLWFFINRKRNEHFLTAFLVTAITTLTYALLLEGSLVAISKSGDPVYFTRWLFYAASCSLLMLTIGKTLKIKISNLLPLITLNVFVMISGALAAALLSPHKWIIFIIGGLFYLAQLIFINEFSSAKIRAKKPVCAYIYFGWSIFPLVFFFAPEGLGIINNFVAAALYLILDIITKIIFYLHLAMPKRKRRR